jgi:hypothetical protein
LSTSFAVVGIEIDEPKEGTTPVIVTFPGAESSYFLLSRADFEFVLRSENLLDAEIEAHQTTTAAYNVCTQKAEVQANEIRALRGKLSNLESSNKVLTGTTIGLVVSLLVSVLIGALT